MARRAAAGAAAGLLLAAGALAWPENARTCVEDIRAAKLLRDRYKDKSPRWTANLRSWYGAGEDCLDCDDDPCGPSWHGPWIGLECRGDWLCDRNNWCYWSGPSAAEGPCKKITNFHLPDRGLEGTLPWEMVYFPNLREIDLDSNQFQGPIGEWMACIPGLIEADLEENQLSGTLPRSLGNLKDMLEFEVDDNPYLTGCIPDGLPFDERSGRVSFSSDPKIGTSYGGTRLSGERCATGPLPDCETIRRLPDDAPWPNWVPENMRRPVAGPPAAGIAGPGDGDAQVVGGEDDAQAVETVDVLVVDGAEAAENATVAVETRSNSVSVGAALVGSNGR